MDDQRSSDRTPLTRAYFQDVDPATIDVEQHATFIIERLLEFGDDVAVVWLEKTYQREQLADVVRTSGRLSRKSGNYFAIKYGIPTEEVQCLTQRSPLTLETPWSR